MKGELLPYARFALSMLGVNHEGYDMQQAISKLREVAGTESIKVSQHDDPDGYREKAGAYRLAAFVLAAYEGYAKHN